MRQEGDLLRLTATDLANHLACHHLSHLDLETALGLRRIPDWFSPDAAILRELGADHEAAFLDHLERQGLRIARLGPSPDEHTGLERTLAAMRDGVDVIAQATLAKGRWTGRADVLRRVPLRSRLGDWSYEVWDTKLSRETKAGSVLQICLYSDLLEASQGARPEFMYVVPPRPDFSPDRYRVEDYLAYYRLVRQRLEALVSASSAPGTYPLPVPHCDVCRWWPACDRQRHRDDHLSLVAGISRLQTRELEGRSVKTLAALADEPLPLGWKPSRGAVESYERAREQARVQRDGRVAGRALYELLPRRDRLGFERLPDPSSGDLFFDLESDPFVGEAGREYLFGWAALDAEGRPEYRCQWGLDPAAERAAFEAFIDLVMQRWKAHPDLHVYHFAPYEPAALKRLMGRYATRENEIDRLLRGERFVDLHAVLRQALRASVEEYSLKKVEALYGFERSVDLREAGVQLRVVQRALELEKLDAVDAEVRRKVEGYNRDDCFSTLQLRGWLETVRRELEAKGDGIPRPVPGEGQPSDNVAERDREVKEVMAALLSGLPAERAARTEQEQARWLLAYLLEWHRREQKAGWWEYFRLRELSDEDLLDEKSAISGLSHAGNVGMIKRRTVDRYRFPAQETSIRRGDKLRLPIPADRDFGEVESIDLGKLFVEVRKAGSSQSIHPTSVFSQEMVRIEALSDSLLRLGHWVADNGIDAPGDHRAARDLLLGRAPGVLGEAGEPLRRPGESGLDAARRLVKRLQSGTLAIQGPPGTGKTYTGARMICDLVRAGKKVGVCAMSHKVIRNLLDKVVEAAREAEAAPRCAHKGPEDDEGEAGGITAIGDNARALGILKSGEASVLGGTAWLWSRPEFLQAVDVLFVDEAGQMSLANVVAIAQCARVLVLLGDPRQLDQPLQGSHPEGTDISALAHLLQGRNTIEENRGLFLEQTWRLPPAICRFTSALFYDARLEPLPDLERQAILDPAPIAGAGLWFRAVRHEGNQSSSPEEVEAVDALVRRLADGSVRWRSREGKEAALQLADILIIAPYNAQVADLTARLPEGARVGTVDRFQGQEAPVVVYSMTTSSPADAPRGMEFLYSLNRFNVATSRAQCACVVVGSPLLFEPECQTPRQMQLANACCRYLELAKALRLEDLRPPRLQDPLREPIQQPLF
ncbi:MAG TPA: TM0106 family RecB-like putative nuclease [Candidatus Polarisedimenticolia bacterium]|nr:TM0106 family RecB-like putative nuclease [Candidatus Polarisedimenticolia bacterium]